MDSKMIMKGLHILILAHDSMQSALYAIARPSICLSVTLHLET